jgi:hypothetical protein
VLESFESLGMPSRNCFDLLVNTIVALACDRVTGIFGVKFRIVLCPIMRAAPMFEEV